MSKPILLMNHTLLSKKDWCQSAPNTYVKDTGETWKQKAERELLEMLCRVQGETPKVAEQGIRFEKQVYQYANMPEDKLVGSEEFKKVVKYVRGGLYQKFRTKDLEFRDFTLRLYGALDVEFGKSIIDIKTTGKFSRSKYLTSGQDKIYRLITEKEQFEYLVAEWDEFPKIKSVNIVPVEDNLSLEEIEAEVRSKVLDFIEWLKDLGLYELYVECYSHKGLGWKSCICKKGPNQEKTLEAFYKPFRDKHLDQFKTIDF